MHPDVEKALDESIRLLGCLFEPDDLIEFISLNSGRYREWCAIESLPDAVPHLWHNNASDNAFFGANPRKERGGEIRHVALARCLFVDFDKSSAGERGCSFEDAAARVEEANLPTPTAWVFTGSGIHAYWRLDGSFRDLDAWRARQLGLIRKLNTDGSIQNPNRLMRLPGFRNVKYASRPMASLIDADPARVYGIEEFPDPVQPKVTMLEAHRSLGAVRPGSISTLSRRFLDEGFTLASGRRSTMFTVACDMHARGWDVEEATAALMARMRRWQGEGGLTESDIADCPRQIRNAFSKPREPIADTATPDEAVIPASHREDESPIGSVSALDLIQRHQSLRPPVIHGLLREGESMNIIAPPKTGKSWLVMDLAFSLARGMPWLGIYPTEPGEVLILDNELHPETSASRVRTVMQARGVPFDVAGRVTIENLRGKLMDIGTLGPFFRSIEAGKYRLVILDAFYRFMPREWDENDNGTMAAVYNLLDSYSAHLGCAMVCIHHASKGNQSGKSVTDVGAGAGAQSRAADTHLVMRAHEQRGAIVLDAAVRSWAPIEPRCFRFKFPVFDLAEDLDPSMLAGLPKRKGSRQEQPEEPVGDADPWTVDRLVAECVPEGGEFSRLAIESNAIAKGVGASAFDRLWESARNKLAARRVQGGVLYSRKQGVPDELI